MFEIYTDGSCDIGTRTGSSAFVILKDSKVIHQNFKYYEEVTNNRTEYIAAINALNYLKDTYGNCNYKLYSDSKLLVNTVQKWMHSWKKKGWRKSGGSIKNLDLVMNLHELSTFHSGAFFWVKGHAGNKWNEHCDRLCALCDKENRKHT